MVCSTRVPSALTAVARSETLPARDGWLMVTVLAAPVPVTAAPRAAAPDDVTLPDGVQGVTVRTVRLDDVSPATTPRPGTARREALAAPAPARASVIELRR